MSCMSYVLFTYIRTKLINVIYVICSFYARSYDPRVNIFYTNAVLVLFPAYILYAHDAEAARSIYVERMHLY
jgi:hypothetical protein